MRYFLGFLVAIGLIILIIFLMFSGGGKPKTHVTTKTLDSYYNTDAAVRLTIDGPINADQNHQEVQITISNDAVIYDQIQGYQGTVVNQQSFANNESAFAVLLHALNYAGFTKGDPTKTLSDERGYCALGNRYIFELTQDGNDIERYWTTSCGKPRTYLGSVQLTIDLFKAQVPNYSQLANKVDL